MRESLIEKMKTEIENNLKIFLHEEGIELQMAANDNANTGGPLVIVEDIKDTPLAGVSACSRKYVSY